MEDFYKILGIEKGATDDDIKKAYRKLAHKYHPDKSGGDEKMFKKINEAYQVLSNREKRAQYDRFGRVFDGGTGGGFDPRNFNGVEFGFDFGNFGDAENLGEVFDAFFEGLGVKRKRRAYERGADLEFMQEITLEEAFRGARKPIKFKTHVSCKTCAGLGHFPKEGFTTCAACDGRGEIQELRKTFFGNFNQVKMCVKCNGMGKIPQKVCDTCRSTGRVMAERDIDLAIAPGVSDDQLIKVSGGGEHGPRGGEAGDLYVRIKVKPHQRFLRERDDLIVKESIPLIEVLAERKVSVRTISGGTIMVEIPTDYRFGDRLSVQGEGMPRLGGGGRGKLFVELEVKMPKHLFLKAKELLEKLKQELE